MLCVFVDLSLALDLSLCVETGVIEKVTPNLVGTSTQRLVEAVV